MSSVINIGGPDSGFVKASHGGYSANAPDTDYLGTFRIGGAHGNNSSFLYHPPDNSFTSLPTSPRSPSGEFSPPVRFMGDSYSASGLSSPSAASTKTDSSSYFNIGASRDNNNYRAIPNSSSTMSKEIPVKHMTSITKNSTATFSLGGPGSGGRFELTPDRITHEDPRDRRSPDENLWSRNSLGPPVEHSLYSPPPRKDTPKFPTYESNVGFSPVKGHNSTLPTSIEFSPVPDGSRVGAMHKFQTEPQVVIVNQDGQIQNVGSALTPSTRQAKSGRH